MPCSHVYAVYAHQEDRNINNIGLSKRWESLYNLENCFWKNEKEQHVSQGTKRGCKIILTKANRKI
jgi:hypothetical protein